MASIDNAPELTFFTPKNSVNFQIHIQQTKNNVKNDNKLSAIEKKKYYHEQKKEPSENISRTKYKTTC